MYDPAGAIGVLFAYLVIPIAITGLLQRARWREIAPAYSLWLLLLVLGLAMGNTAGEILGWPMILALFLTTPVIPILVWLARVFRRKNISKAGA